MDNNKNLQSILRDALEKEIPSSQVNLMPAIKSSLVAKKIIRQGETVNTIKPRRISRAAFVTLVIIILLALTLITPQGRAFAHSILQFFIRSQSDTIPVPTAQPITWVDVTPGVPAATMTPLPQMAVFAKECGDFGSATCTVEQIRSKVNFTVKEPANLPEGLYFVGATGGPDSVQISYHFKDMSGSLHITEERWKGNPSPQTDLVGASAKVEQVQIGGLTGEYFKGIFVAADGDNVAHWDPNFFGLETLRWVDAGISYTMEYAYPPAPLGKEGMAALAQSMTSEPVAKQPAPVATEDPYVWNPKDTYNLSVSEAEQQAGFKLLLPAKLPDIVSLIGASYDSDYKMVQVFYLLDQNQWGPNTDGVLLRQQVAADPAKCLLCDVTIGDYNKFAKEAANTKYFKEIVPSAKDIETVQIGALTGKYIQGVWQGTDCCGWQWDPTVTRKVLHWQQNGMAFELTYFGEHIEKADLIRIAESIK
jgi:hypothetical protein